MLTGTPHRYVVVNTPPRPISRTSPRESLSNLINQTTLSHSSDIPQDSRTSNKEPESQPDQAKQVYDPYRHRHVPEPASTPKTTQITDSHHPDQRGLSILGAAAKSTGAIRDRESTVYRMPSHYGPELRKERTHTVLDKPSKQPVPHNQPDSEDQPGLRVAGTAPSAQIQPSSTSIPANPNFIPIQLRHDPSGNREQEPTQSGFRIAQNKPPSTSKPTNPNRIPIQPRHDPTSKREQQRPLPDSDDQPRFRIAGTANTAKNASAACDRPTVSTSTSKPMNPNHIEIQPRPRGLDAYVRSKKRGSDVNMDRDRDWEREWERGRDRERSRSPRQSSRQVARGDPRVDRDRWSRGGDGEGRDDERGSGRRYRDFWEG